MEKFKYVIFLFGLCFFSGCEQGGISSNDSAFTQVKGSNYTVFISKEMYHDLLLKRSAEVSDDFIITNVKRVEKENNFYLEIEISHQVCSPDLRIIWDGTVAESHPVQVYLFIQLAGGNECPDEEIKTDLLSLDLLDLLGDKAIAEQAIIHVLNASNREGGNDYSDVPVSSGNDE